MRGQYTKTAIWTMRADGRHQRRIIRLGDKRTPYRVEPSFSPSGGPIVFQASSLDRHGRNPRQRSAAAGVRLEQPGGVRSPECSPDGKRIAFVGRPKGGTTDQHLDHGPRRISPAPRDSPSTQIGLDDSPDWRPDGRRIIFLHRDCEAGAASAMYRYGRMAGPTPRRLELLPGVYSPAGNRIALYGLRYGSIFKTSNAQTSSVTRLGDDRQGGDPQLRWGPDPRPLHRACGGPSWQAIPAGLGPAEVGVEESDGLLLATRRGGRSR